MVDDWCWDIPDFVASEPYAVTEVGLLMISIEVVMEEEASSLLLAPSANHEHSPICKIDSASRLCRLRRRGKSAKGHLNDPPGSKEDAAVVQ